MTRGGRARPFRGAGARWWSSSLEALVLPARANRGWAAPPDTVTTSEG